MAYPLWMKADSPRSIHSASAAETAMWYAALIFHNMETGKSYNFSFYIKGKLASSNGMYIRMALVLELLKKEKYKSIIGEGNHHGEKIILAKPTTYMNNSGEAVALLKGKFKDARVIVAVDDIDLARGVVRYREHGSAGTHNGLRSIVSYIGQEFERVKVGGGRDESKDLADYVLSQLSEDESKQLDSAVNDAAKKILELIG